MLLKSNTPYIAQYDSKALRGEDDPCTPRPWDLRKIIIDHCKGKHSLLDIGCGTAFKLFPIAPHIKVIYGLDPSESMIQSAHDKLSSVKIDNIKLSIGRGEALPFDSNSMDIITCMLSRWDIREIHRVIEKKGIVIVEHVGCEDKKDFKMLFGKDKDGWRGQYIDSNLEYCLNTYKNLFLEYFETVSVMNGYWDTYYTQQGIHELLKYTPTIRNYDVAADQGCLDKAIKLFNTPRGIKLTQNRILICAKAPRFLEI